MSWHSEVAQVECTLKLREWWLGCKGIVVASYTIYYQADVEASVTRFGRLRTGLLELGIAVWEGH